ncbi:hypothetical protein JQN58_12335 [Aneurinibacillus sp. BA2021]|nr:hypothetical protein [Aneurinibacillus sp. BA2021]
MAQQARSKKAATAEKTTMDKRLTNIETSLSEMEMQICQTKETINKIEAMLVQLQQLPNSGSPQKGRAPRTHAKRQNATSHSPTHIPPTPLSIQRREEKPASLSAEKGLAGMLKDVDPAAIATILQNPAVQALIVKSLNSGVAEKPAAKRKKTTIKNDEVNEVLGSIDFVQIAKLLQNPMVQSMLKNML